MVKSNVRKSGYIFEYRLAFLGGKATGKTSVINRFLSDTFTHRYRPTIEDHLTHIIDHNGNMCVCLIVDTSGCRDFPAMRRLAITKGNAFLVVYSINDRRSFDEAIETVNEVKRLKPETEDVKIIIIGNKNDLEHEREVERHEGEALVKSINNNNVSSMFMECSAKNNQNIDIVFTNMLNMFIPEQSVPESITPERSAFTRISLRKKSRKNRLQKSNPTESLSQQNTNFSSDTNLSRSDYNVGQLLRSSSVASSMGYESSDSDGLSSQRSKSLSKNELKRQNTAKDILKRTFGSMQKLIRPEQEIKRSNTLDPTHSLIKHKQTTI
ncbi:GTP-binding protein Di-Ras2-like [Hydractinia symbiolongicarpus]|uniref:GTP-binding protein Di-Ras2-like n=1 Tax=Hydractinia symbiolongicarpus TaxID=13093 RepID=UPI00254D20CD|nr:GTP-binding protein Di-Ras2-like [Hydractinia symbiolongicarpus]